jgi:hypothetical protein
MLRRYLEGILCSAPISDQMEVVQAEALPGDGAPLRVL